jgi:hypothetical protein
MKCKQARKLKTKCVDQRHFLNDNSLWASQGISHRCGSRSHLRKTAVIGVCPVPDQSLFRMILIIFASSVSRFPKRFLPFRIAHQNFIFVYHIFCACCMSAHPFLTNVLLFALQAILTTDTVNVTSQTFLRLCLFEISCTERLALLYICTEICVVSVCLFTY